MVSGCTFDGSALEDRECQGPTARCPSGFACVEGYCLEMDEPDVPIDVEPDLPPDEPEVDVETDPFAGCIDDDEDGFFRNELGCPVTAAEADCNDDNEDIFPGAPEMCNDIDDDCDTVIDNDLTPPLCAEQRGACEGATKQCRNGAWQDCTPTVFSDHNPAYLENEAYCARGVDELKGWCVAGDSNFETVQAADDALCDLVDNDCDGMVDEMADIPCFQEDQGTAVNENATLVAAANYCRAGVRRCVDGAYMGGCAEQVTPIEESTPELRCDADDNDCNGVVEERCTCDIDRTDPIVDDCTCNPQTTLSCYPFDDGVAGVGECTAGIHTCGNDSRYGPCEGAVGPAAESCANLGTDEDPRDDDCDGEADNIDGVEYGSYCRRDDLEGVCQDGTNRCDVAGDDGIFSCYPDIEPGSQPELCADRGFDNDCDGDTEDITIEGVGDVHVGDPCTVPEALGICAPGTWACGQDGPECEPNMEAQGADTICNGLDDDCDGPVDDEVDFRFAPNCGECGENCDGDNIDCCPRADAPEIGECVSQVDNPLHCGGCGTVSEVHVCDTENDEECCGSVCANTQTSNDHCGGCNQPCLNGTTCCGGTCVDTDTNIDNCGQCGVGCNAETEQCCIHEPTDPNFPSCYPVIQCGG